MRSARRSCENCVKFRKSVANAAVINDAGTNPSILELAYIVNFEYYTDMKYNCIHEVPEDKNATISVKEMVDFLENRKWQIGTRTIYDEGFKCTSFINHPSKQLVIVHRGTENFTQVKLDVKLFFKMINQDVIKMADWHTSQSLMNNTLVLDNNRFVKNDFSVTVTGHSLGGWLAQICTLISKYPQFYPVGPRNVQYFANGYSVDMNQSYNLHCVAFDSPGSGYILNELDGTTRKNALLQKSQSEVQIALESLDITIYLSNPNPVNSWCGQHFGNVNRIDVMSETKSDTWLGWLRELNPLTSHQMARILMYFVKKNK